MKKKHSYAYTFIDNVNKMTLKDMGRAKRILNNYNDDELSKFGIAQKKKLLKEINSIIKSVTTQ